MAEKLTCRIRPLHDNIVVRRDEADEKIGRILLPDQAKERPCRGTVVRIGPGRCDSDLPRVPVEGQETRTCPDMTVGRRPLSVKVGDKVLFNKYGGAEFCIDEVEWIMITDEHLLGIVEPE